MNSKARITLIVLAAVLLFLLIPVAQYGSRYMTETLRKEVVRAIEGQFDGKAQLQDFQFTWSWYPRVTGTKLLLWYRGRTDLPPLISVEKFTLDLSLSELWHHPTRIRRVQLEKLMIQIPPKEDKPLIKPASMNRERTSISSKPVKHIDRFIVENVFADGSLLRILPKKKASEPMDFELYKLKLRSIGSNIPADYDAFLKNAKPPGLIHARGHFGPWQTSDPGATAVSGKFLFEHADLSVFRGISGKLSSTGQFQGILRRIEASGTTDVPDFAVETAKHPVHLTTDYQSVIDGTNGDTYLQPVKAYLGKTSILCRGGIARKQIGAGKSVILDVEITDGRIEDLLTLVIPGQPSLVGSIKLNASFELPPGNQDIVKKLNLKGTFLVASAEFTSDTVQNKIETLSMRSRGIHDQKTNERIVSNLRGSIVLNEGTASFSRLSFSVPGAEVVLHGNYGLINQRLNFEGQLQMQAKLSQTQTGIKSILLKAVDPFFKKGKAGAVIPIKITGTRSQPQFGLNF